MNCKECPNRKETGALEQLDGTPEWVCTHKHTETEDIVCLLRMIIWQLSTMEEEEEEDGTIT